MFNSMNLGRKGIICWACEVKVTRCMQLQLELPQNIKPREFSRSYQQKRIHRVGHQPPITTLKELVYVQDSHNRRIGPRFRHLNLHEDKISLPIKALGEPAVIRVVRDKPHRPKDLPPARNEPLNREFLEDFLKDATTQSGTSTTEEAVENIQQLRKAFMEQIGPAEDPYLEECRTVGDTLLNGFKASQLQAYIQATGTATTIEPDDLNALFKGQTYTRSRWYAGDFPEEAGRRLDPKFAQKDEKDALIMPETQTAEGTFRQTYKARLVERILRRCWNLRTWEEKARPGSVDLAMNVGTLDVLLKNNIFAKISETSGVKIDVAPTFGFVRTYGVYEVCRLALQAIAVCLESVRVETIDLGSRVRVLEPKRRSLWDSMEKLTNTKIVAKGDQTIDVVYLTSQSSSLEDVRRFATQVREYFERKPPDSQHYPKNIAPVLVPVNAESGLTFCEREERWYRWREKRLHPRTPVNLQQLAMPAAESIIVQDLKDRFRNIWTALASDYWDSRPEQTVSASFGSIVHALQTLTDFENRVRLAGGGRVQRVETALNSIKQHRRTFIPNIPSIVATMDQLVKDAPTLFNYIRILLKPDLERFPLLELEVRLDGQHQTTKLASAHLRHNIRVKDLLLPVQGTDVRFTSQTSFSAKPENYDPAILTFLANSNLNIWGNDRLKTPHRLALNLPSHTANGGTQIGKDVQYSFLSLSVCSDMESLFQGFPLVLSTIEAGKSGGRRQELKLELHGYSESIDEEKKEISRLDDETLSLWNAEFTLWYGAVREVVATISR